MESTINPYQAILAEQVRHFHNQMDLLARMGGHLLLPGFMAMVRAATFQQNIFSSGCRAFVTNPPKKEVVTYYHWICSCGQRSKSFIQLDDPPDPIPCERKGCEEQMQAEVYIQK